MVLFFIFIHLHLASHLDTLDAPREGPDVELNPKMVLAIHPEDGRTLECMPGVET
jgi:hypothetical protein